MSEAVPATLDGASVELYAQIEGAQRPTGRTRHSLNTLEEKRSHLAIARYDGDLDYYLFHCSADWEVLADTCHPTRREAIEQGKFEFENVEFVPLGS
ncbi:hypothetical protein ABZY31_28965 [Streptomyces sp. NPDC006529]|uniref:hypothetical protein n=1 Tax=Streptomyces sp. NPDC006529 TaxID=3157177 RepID=UPI0033B62FD1